MHHLSKEVLLISPNTSYTAVSQWPVIVWFWVHRPSRANVVHMLHKDICDISPFNKYGSSSSRPSEATTKDVLIQNSTSESKTQRYVCVCFQFNQSLSGSVVIISRCARRRVHVGCGWVHVWMITVASNAGWGIRGRPGFGSQVVFVGGWILVGMMMQGVWWLRVSVEAKFVRWAAWASCEGHGMEAAEDWKGRAEDSRH